ncbi:unnamed protein product [Blepharisma stoltei]|uniref:Kelch motif family protein n=1 Tax=Blepharisma stoltei TaxID=1481888 RepID=A0AAU9JHK8_9CILI|nr:unnamed protein product [Blepharisma stoltei]
MEPIKRSAQKRSKILTQELNKKILELSSLEKYLQEQQKKYLSGELSNYELTRISLEKEFENISLIEISPEERKFLSEISSEFMTAYSKYIDAWNSIKTSLKIFAEQLNFESKFMYSTCGAPSKTGVMVYDIKNSRLSQAEIKVPESFDKACLVQLPNWELFSFGCWEFSSAKAYIFDLKTLSIKRRLPNGPNASWCVGVYYQNCIFIFGGMFELQILDIAYKFDLATNHWIRLTPIPVPSFGCSCLVFQENILICGFFFKKLYKFDRKIESYSELPFVSVTECRLKLLATFNLRVYLIEIDGKVMESEIGNEYNWNKIGDIKLGEEYGFIHAKQCDSCLYGVLFGIDTVSCFKFDLKKKKMEEGRVEVDSLDACI